MIRLTIGAALISLPSLAHAELSSSVFPTGASEIEKIKHCVAVNYANALAGLVGSEIANLSSKPREYYFGDTVQTNLPADWILEAIGGMSVLADAQKVALGWEKNWRSQGETYWAPIKLNDGEPYNVHEGRLLAAHTIACAEYTHAITIKYGRGFYSKNTQEVSLPE